MKNLKIILLITLAFSLIFLSIAYVFYMPNMQVGSKIYFESSDKGFKFTAIPSKGRDYKMMEKLFSNYKSKNNIGDSINLLRISRINYFNISKWCEYKRLPEWNYPRE